jgi:GntR family transcriptional regulator/MocR family aminotransferase
VVALAESGCEVVVETPAHQFPTGVVLSSGRRTELLGWAEEVDGLIVEDDYDSELRYDRDPVGALQGLAPERVCHIGSASQRLAPALRLGWVLSPSWLTGARTYEKALADGGSPAVDQLTLAEFIERGELDRHLRRMRLRYRDRREALVDALQDLLPAATMSGAPAGLHTLVILPDGSDENVLVREAASRRVGVVGLTAHCVSADPPPAPGTWSQDAGAGRALAPGLVVGYGSLPAPAIRRGVALLAEAAEEARA